jgi:hypothetical protein
VFHFRRALTASRAPQSSEEFDPREADFTGSHFRLAVERLFGRSAVFCSIR